MPLLIDDDVSIPLLPPILSKIQIINYFKNDKNDLLSLIKAFNSTKKEVLPSPLPHPPAIPTSYLGQVTQQIESDTELNYEKQTFLMSEIKRSIDQSHNNNDIESMLTLLKRFRRRRDLYAYTADDIDVIINRIDSSQSESKRNINEILEENIYLKNDNNNLKDKIIKLIAYIGEDYLPSLTNTLDENVHTEIINPHLIDVDVIILLNSFKKISAIRK